MMTDNKNIYFTTQMFQLNNSLLKQNRTNLKPGSGAIYIEFRYVYRKYLCSKKQLERILF